MLRRLIVYFSFSDLLDILIVSFLTYYLIVFIRDARIQQLLKGILLIYVAYLLATWLKLNTLLFIIDIIVNNGILAVIIVFHPELRSFLEHMGRSKFNVGSIFGVEDDPHEAQLSAINGVVEAFRTLQKQKMGALVVFEQEDRLNDIAATGTQVDSVPNAGVIANLFFNKAPLHDGAVIIRDGRVHSAGCILPLTKSTQIPAELGTRHRAAIGMSENSDAVVVVLSEETGQLSIARGGRLVRFDTVTEFTSELMQILLPSSSGEPHGSGIPFLSGVRRTLRKIGGGKNESAHDDGAGASASADSDGAAGSAESGGSDGRFPDKRNDDNG